MDLTALIKAALIKAGLPEDLHEQIKADEEKEIDGLVEEFKKTYVPPTKTLAEMLKDENFKKELDEYTTKAMQPEIDRRVTQALKTYDDKMKGKGTGEEGDEDDKFTKLQTQIASLTEALTGQQAAQKEQGLKATAAAALKEAGLPDNWIDRVAVKEEGEIEGAVKALTEEMTGIKQGVIDQAIKDNPIPGLSFGTPAGGTGVIDGFVKDLKSEDSSVAVEKIE